MTTSAVDQLLTRYLDAEIVADPALASKAPDNPEVRKTFLERILRLVPDEQVADAKMNALAIVHRRFSKGQE